MRPISIATSQSHTLVVDLGTITLSTIVAFLTCAGGDCVLGEASGVVGATGVAGATWGSAEDVGMGVVFGDGTGDAIVSFGVSLASFATSFTVSLGACGSGLAGEEVDLGDSIA